MRIFVVLAVSLTFLAAAGAKTLQQAYDEAGPGEGYDKLLILNPSTTYTGGCNLLQGKKSCIRGNGALCDLDNGSILATGLHTDLYLSGCCLIDCNEYSAAVSVYEGATATVDGNTICKGNMGVVVWLLSKATIKNNIIFGNAKYGIARHQNTPTLTILYNDVHNNPGGNYMYLCVG
jgi:hypothetical protein